VLGAKFQAQFSPGLVRGTTLVNVGTVCCSLFSRLGVAAALVCAALFDSRAVLGAAFVWSAPPTRRCARASEASVVRENAFPGRLQPICGYPRSVLLARPAGTSPDEGHDSVRACRSAPAPWQLALQWRRSTFSYAARR